MTNKSILKKRSLITLTTSMMLFLPVGQVLAIDTHTPDVQSDGLVNDQLVTTDESIDIEESTAASESHQETTLEANQEEDKGNQAVVLPVQEARPVVDQSEMEEEGADAPSEMGKIALPPGINAVYTGQVGTIPWVIDNTGTLTLGSGIFDEVNDPVGNYEQDAYFNAPHLAAFINRIVLTGDIQLVGSQRGTNNYSDQGGWGELGGRGRTRGFFEGMQQVQRVEGMHHLDTSNLTDMSYMFHYLSLVTELDITSFDTSNVTSMVSTFSGMRRVNQLDFSNFDTSKVVNMAGMFQYTDTLTELDLSSFNTSNVTDMSYMFIFMLSLKNLNISSFDTSNVARMTRMFSELDNLSILDLSHFDTSNVTDMLGMFMNASALTELDLSNFDTSKVTHMQLMFSGCANLRELDLANFDSRSTAVSTLMFRDAPLQKLTLGTGFQFPANHGLAELGETDTHFPFWRNVGAGTSERPRGTHVLSSADLATTYDGATMADTWVWQPRIFSSLTIGMEGQGTVSQDVASVESGQIIDINATADAGWRFSHWRIESGEGTIADEKESTTTFMMGEEHTKLVAVFEDLGELLSVRIPTSAVFNTTSSSNHRQIISPDYEIGNESPFAISVDVVAPTELKNMDIVEALNVVGDGKENLLIHHGSSYQTEAFRLFDLAIEEVNTFTFTGEAEKLPEGSSHATPTFNLVLRFGPNLSN
ncbi:hypothetical protein B835_905 [Enterococcus mundtii 3F]|uniref:BspA family leucine-rich repeat surface protein n=1 Tax=Enterococcus mundtii TaxID=53346 RepID=UPI0023042290|nr:BspA family leucine-rich repeat surface protein [Enterococcus mundtii]MDA9461018.1 hypothetical protein [Enterococcus mundtii 3F]